ncbi:MAG: hypothetical protein FJZ89_00130 [Chloroflexi bacterium]|nr:hypothetical protein [Chloroflexota bacterium]
MRTPYDFSHAERGKFYHPDTVFSFPVYLEPDVDDFMSRLADEKGLDIQRLVNDWRRVSIQLLRSVQPRS